LKSEKEIMFARNRTAKVASVGQADPEGFFNLTNEVLGHALLRMGLGLAFMAHGLSRIWILSAFAESVTGMFAKTGLPEILVVPIAYAVPPVEFIVGVGLLLGLFLRPALVIACLDMWALMFGSILIQKFDIALIQLVYLTVLALLTATLRYDRLSIDGLRRRKEFADARTHPAALSRADEGESLE
jgi:thiosulfate dehydrogenase (quinone) large subunit